MKREKMEYRLKKELDAARYAHTLGVEQTAREMARQFGEDEEKAALAGLLHDTGVKTTIVEHHSEKARWLSEALPAANIIHGDGTDQQLLLSEGLRTTDAFIALTDRDEENLMTGLYATQYANCKVIVKSTRVNYTEMLKNMGMDGIISPLQVACNIILRTVRALANGYGTAVERMYRIMSDKAEALEFIARAGAPTSAFRCAA